MIKLKFSVHRPLILLQECKQQHFYFPIPSVKRYVCFICERVIHGKHTSMESNYCKNYHHDNKAGNVVLPTISMFSHMKCQITVQREPDLFVMGPN